MGEQFPSFVGEQAQRGLSLVAVFGDNALVRRPLLLKLVIALFAAPVHPAHVGGLASAPASAVDHENGGRSGRVRSTSHGGTFCQEGAVGWPGDPVWFAGLNVSDPGRA